MCKNQREADFYHEHKKQAPIEIEKIDRQIAKLQAEFEH